MIVDKQGNNKITHKLYNNINGNSIGLFLLMNDTDCEFCSLWDSERAPQYIFTIDEFKQIMRDMIRKPNREEYDYVIAEVEKDDYGFYHYEPLTKNQLLKYYIMLFEEENKYYKKLIKEMGRR